MTTIKELQISRLEEERNALRAEIKFLKSENERQGPPIWKVVDAENERLRVALRELRAAYDEQKIALDVARGIPDEYNRRGREIQRLRAALAEIAKGEGAFSLDRFTHACNCIENMKSIAKSALREGVDQNFPPESHPQGGEP